MTGVREHICIVCNKHYTSRQTLWKHNKKFHNTLNNQDNHIDNHNDNHTNNHNNNKKKYNCKKCNKIFGKYQHRWRHEQTCNKNIQIINNNTINNNNTIINNDNRQINTNNNINIKLIINKIGSEDINELTENEIKQILLKNGEAITKYIELINFNKELPNNHSFCTTNLKSKYLDVFNTNTKTIDKDRKKYFFDKLLKNAVNKIKKLFEIYKSEEYIINNHDKVKQMLKSSIELGEKFFNDKILKELFNKIELLSYNKKNLIKNTWDGNNNSNYKLIRKIKKLIVSIISYKIIDNKNLENNTILINSLIKKIKNNILLPIKN